MPFPEAVVAAQGAEEAAERGVDPAAARDWCWVTAVLLNYLGVGMDSAESAANMAGAERPRAPGGPTEAQRGAILKVVDQVVPERG